MTGHTYVVDSSSLIRLHRNVPRDIFPSVWKRLSGLVASRRMVSPIEVRQEILSGDDRLSKWAAGTADLFVRETAARSRFTADLLSDYPSLSDDDRPNSADVPVVALALELGEKHQKRLDIEGYVVVTEESPRGNEINIPFVCKKRGIMSLNILGMLRAEQWKF